MITNFKEFYKDKKILVTGHTGFKGSWLCQCLIKLGAKVVGYALETPRNELFELLELEKNMESIIGDIRDYEHLYKVFSIYRPEIVFHLAAQPIVRESYRHPLHTYEINVMGTVNVLECIRLTDSVKSFVNVTTDKVYENKEWIWGYRESDILNGGDPYSNSKSCSELITKCYCNSFFYKENKKNAAVISMARAGNVIGGGDFAKDRILPDCIRAALTETNIKVRNKDSIRPYQHVLEPIYAYLLIAGNQYRNSILAGAYNVGPNESDCYKTGELVNIFCEYWKKFTGKKILWYSQQELGSHEAKYLQLDSTKMKKIFMWESQWNLREAIKRTVEWFVSYQENKDVIDITNKQIDAYQKLLESWLNYKQIFPAKTFEMTKK